MEIKDDELLKKDPFKFDRSEGHIACVGNNGGTTNNTILEGFKSAVLIIIKDIRDDSGIQDELIYPLVYSMRHCVELALKISINLIKDICDKKSVKFVIEEKTLFTHDIKKLSEAVKQLYIIDKRIPGLFDIALDYAKDFYFDNHSDIFRYECTHTGKKMLNEFHITHICIDILEKKFLRFYELLDDAIYDLISIKEEYSVNTWTNNLSRNDIEQISKELLPRNRWNETDFDDNKNEIKEKYGLSNKELIKAIDIVQNNPLFANNIKVFIPLGKIKEDELHQYGNLILEITEPDEYETKVCNIGEVNDDFIEELTKNEKKRYSLAEDISNKALFSLAAFANMVETRDKYCENYQEHYNYFKNNHYFCRDWFISKVGNYSFALKVLKGMEICGQSEYINVLLPYIKKIAKDYNFPSNYE